MLLFLAVCCPITASSALPGCPIMAGCPIMSDHGMFCANWLLLCWLLPMAPGLDCQGNILDTPGGNGGGGNLAGGVPSAPRKQKSLPRPRAVPPHQPDLGPAETTSAFPEN